MSLVKEGAAPGKHRIDGPPRLNSRRCGEYHTAVNGFNQSASSASSPKDKPSGASMSHELAVKREEEFSLIEQVVMQGDLSKLNPEQRVMYYRKVCDSAGLNPFTRPFDYILLNGKLTLYAKKDCTEQLRKLNGISIEGLESKIVDDLFIVKAKAKDKTGRLDESTGAVTIGHLKGDAKANAIMKAETKAKRRVTLSISGLGWVDETEVETIPNANRIDVDLSTGEIKNDSAQKVLINLVEEKPKLTVEQMSELEIILGECDEKYRNWVYAYVKRTFKSDDLTGVTADMYERMKTAALKNMDQQYAKQRAESESELMAVEA